MTARKIVMFLLLLPALLIVAFFLYAGISNDPGCGSNEPGTCFGVGVLMMFVAPIALLTTPAAIIIFIIKAIENYKDKRSPSHE